MLRKVVDLVKDFVNESFFVSSFHFIAAAYPKSGSTGLFLWADGDW